MRGPDDPRFETAAALRPRRGAAFIAIATASLSWALAAGTATAAWPAPATVALLGLLLVWRELYLSRRLEAAGERLRTARERRDGAEARWRGIAEGGEQGCWSWQPGEPRIALSASATGLLAALGWPGDGRLRPVLRRLPARIRRQVLQALRAALAGNDPGRRIEFTVPDQAGHACDLVLRIGAAHDLAGRLCAIVGTLLDCSELTRLRANRAAVEAYLGRVLDEVPLPLLVRGADLRYRQVNRAAIRLLGADSPAGLRSPRAGAVPEDFAAAQAALDVEVIETGFPVTVEARPGLAAVGWRKLRLNGPDGEPLVLSVALDSAQAVSPPEAAPARTGPAGFLACLTPATEAALNAILALARERETGGGEGAGERLAAIFRHAQQLRDVFDDLRDLGRLESGRLVLALASSDLAEIVRAALHSFERRIGAGRLSVHRRLPARACMVRCDAARTGRLLRNLLSNAAKSTPVGGELELILDLADPAPDPQWPAALGVRFARLRICESGGGIPEDQVAKICDDPGQRPPAGADLQPGGGELIVARALAEMQHGRFAARRRERGGRCLELQLPLADQEAEAPMQVAG